MCTILCTHERGRDGLYPGAYGILFDKVLDLGLI